MKKRNGLFFKYLLHDLRCGLTAQWLKYLLAFVPFAMLCLRTFTLANSLAETFPEADVPAPGYGDYLFAILRNTSHLNYVGQVTLYDDFGLPIRELSFNLLWLVPPIFLAFIVSFYPFKDLAGYGQQLLIRSRRRSTWWISKCTWVFACVTLYHGVLLATPALFALATGTMDFMPSVFLQVYASYLDLRTFTPWDMVLYAVLLPWLVCLTHSLVQLTVSLYTQPIYGMMTVCALLVTSVFFPLPILPGNYMSIMRCGFYVLDPLVGVLCMAALCIVSVVAGGLYFKRKNIFSA